MSKRSSVIFVSLALSCALITPVAAQTQTEKQLDRQNQTLQMQPAPTLLDNVRADMDNPEDVDRTEMEIQTTEPSISARPSVDPSEIINARPFSLEANYMSIPGDFRYLTYERSGVWLTRDEAVAQVNTEIESATR